MDPYIRRVSNNKTTIGLSNLNGDETGALPLAALSENDKDPSLQYEGFCIDLLNSIAKALNFNYEIYEVEDGHFGAQDETTGEWRGLVRELIDKVSFFCFFH